MTSKLEHALSLAEKGFFVFPLVDGGKEPIVKDWRNKSTRNKDSINKFWRDSANNIPSERNIGIDTGKSGLLVIDVDVSEGKPGRQSEFNLDMEYGLPTTLEARTRSGGKHLFYKDTGFHGSSASKLAPAIDTRGYGGYVVAPGSFVDERYDGVAGNYEWVREIIPCDLPEWVGPRLASARKKDANTVSVTEDKQSDIDRAALWLASNAEGAVQGNGGDEHTFKIAARVKDFGVSKETALDLMYDLWNEKCSPPWLFDDLKVKVENAFQYAQNSTGVLSAEAEFGTEPLPMQITENPNPQPIAFTLTPLSPFEFKDIPPRDWVYGDFAVRKKVSIITAPGGAGKSTLTLSMALSKAKGDPFMNIGTHGRGAVAVYNNEDDLEEMHRRVAATMQYHKVTFDDLVHEGKPMFFLNSGEDRPFRIAKRADGKIVPADCKALIEHLIKNDIAMLILDPLAETHPASENSNEEMLEVAKMYRYVAQKANCAIILVHHTRKLDSASSDGHEGNLDSMRGASSLGGVARFVLTFMAMSSKRAKEYGIDELQRHRYVGLVMAKANLSAPSVAVWWFERIGERVGMLPGDPDSGEEVGVLKAIKLDRSVVSATAATHILACDIEALTEDNAGVGIKELAEQLVQNFPMHQGKKVESLRRAINRMFDEGKQLGMRGMMVREPLPIKTPGKQGQQIVWRPLEA